MWLVGIISVAEVLCLSGVMLCCRVYNNYALFELTFILTVIAQLNKFTCMHIQLNKITSHK